MRVHGRPSPPDRNTRQSMAFYAACHHVALLTPEALLRAGLTPAAKVLDLKGRLRCRGCGRKGRAVVSISGGGRAREQVPFWRRFPAPHARPLGKGATPGRGIISGAAPARLGPAGS